MPERPATYWTLAEAAAWVMSRDMAVVNRFSPPKPHDWGSFLVFPYEDGEFSRVAEPSELFDALRSGALVAYARHRDPGSRVEPIPEYEWYDLVEDVEGPYRNLPSRAQDMPWLDIRVSRADVERLWRRQSEIEGRTRFPWPWLKKHYADLRLHNPDLSKNELIAELQLLYQQEFGREPPSRSSIQRQVSDR